jgi:protein-S-isoprenylcysteine O-methyltransferase Ste14
VPDRTQALSTKGHWALFALGSCALAVLLPLAWRESPARLRAVGLMLVCASFPLVAIARLQLGSAFSVRPRARHLVTTGLYARIRNPIYVFSAIFVAGVFLILDRPWLLLLLVPLALVQRQRAQREAHVLEQRFGAAYRLYREKTWF